MMSSMAKQLSIELAYDAPHAAVAAMLSDPAFRERVLDAQHVLSRTVTIDGGDVALVYTLSVAGGVPSIAAKFVGDTIEVHHEETWDAAFTHGTLAVALPGKPGDLRGTMSLTERNGTTLETVALTAKVSIPLVAGKLEDLVLSTFKEAYDKEHRVGVSWLEDERRSQS